MVPSLDELYSGSDSDPTPIVSFLHWLAESYALPQPLHVLDVGCGPGRLLLPLERLRWQVTGMEPNPAFLASARAVARSSRRLRVQEGGFRDVDESEAYELVVAINSSFAHLLLPEERADALRRIHEALRPGGVVCLDLPNLLWVLTHYRDPEPYAFTVHGQAVTLHRRHEIDYHEATFTTTDEYLLAADGSRAARLVHVYGLTGLPELRHHLGEAGFVDLRTFNGYDSRAVERLSGGRMLLAARKPG